MGLNNTPSSERIQIGFLGRTNAGKSSLINAICGQQVSLVSDIKGTTTDPLKKSMELLPLGPVLLIDTPGLDDNSKLGELRQQRTKEILQQIHIAVIVIDAREGMQETEIWLQRQLEERNIPYLVVYNKKDLLPESNTGKEPIISHDLAGKKIGKTTETIFVSAATKENMGLLKEKIASIPIERTEKKLVSDLLAKGDHVVLVIPIDKAAPKGRLILPQQQTIRDILDVGCTLSVCQVETLVETLDMLKKPPRLIITDSQVFSEVKDLIPETMMLTSFSILFARYKGDLEGNVKGAFQIGKLKDGDKILISEGCTHHRQCGDIGTQKLPQWILKHTGKKLNFEFTSGENFPLDLSKYQLIIHCGGCMLNEKQMQERLARAKHQRVPMTNYGITIAFLNHILERSIEFLMYK